MAAATIGNDIIDVLGVATISIVIIKTKFDHKLFDGKEKQWRVPLKEFRCRRESNYNSLTNEALAQKKSIQIVGMTRQQTRHRNRQNNGVRQRRMSKAPNSQAVVLTVSSSASLSPAAVNTIVLRRDQQQRTLVDML